MKDAERDRLEQAREGVPWRRWGPYLSERQWGTVREDYSENGDAWNYFSHDQARSRAYRWGEDGLAGISDDKGLLCLALAFWNGEDPILKERLFGLTNSEGNHGEDVKEYYFYVDNTPTHSWMRWRYMYPQAAYPYADLVSTNASRGPHDFEYELLDTGVFDDDRYFEIVADFAKAGTDDLLVSVTVTNHGPDDAPIHVLPTLWFRNTWSWGERTPKPSLEALPGARPCVRATHDRLGEYYLHVAHDVPLLFCDNEHNRERLWGEPNDGPYVKDGIGRAVVEGEPHTVNASSGTKVAAHHELTVPAGGSVEVRVRLTAEAPSGDAFADFDEVMARRADEADAFYTTVIPPKLDEDQALVVRQALAGMLWTKQHYYFDLDLWLREHSGHPLRPPTRHGVRNQQWFDMINDDVISMPDKWEYPWYAAWDLAFHTLPLAMVDPDFARQQLSLMLSGPYLHPNGQIPAYEWNFDDVNPPVHAWALAMLTGIGVDPSKPSIENRVVLEEAFAKLLLNFTWWVNRKDPTGRNLFQGGFLGLDNIGVFDRSARLPGGGTLEQSDGTAWMAFYSQSMLELSILLALDEPAYEGFVAKFVQHFFQIATAMDPLGDHPDEMWDEEQGFYYDVLRMPDGSGRRIRVNSLVGLLPLCATAVVPEEVLSRFPSVMEQVRTYLTRNEDLLGNVADPRVPGVKGRRLLALVDERKLRLILRRMLDEDRFLGPHGIRSVSRWHLDHPYSLQMDGQTYSVQYEPAESTTRMFGGNSNWRGPVWFPINVLIVRALLQFYLYYGDDFLVECPTGSGQQMTLYEVAEELSRRLVSTFTRDASGHRPVFGGSTKFQEDPAWRDNVLFHEYFHGDNGAGLGASHQTGWTGVVARLAQLFASTDAEEVLNGPVRPLATPYRPRDDSA
ncbi:MAG TPA: glucosidase [Actinomycetes bacterium]|nr:glucosidase [Actinomycetes bacterium]